MLETQGSTQIYYPKPDRLSGATRDIIRALGNGQALWKNEIASALGQYHSSTVLTALYRLYHGYGLALRDEFNMYSLSDMGSKVL